MRLVMRTIFMFAMVLCLHRNDAAMDRRKLKMQINLQSQALKRNTASNKLIERKRLADKPEICQQSTFTLRLNLRGGEDEDDPITGMIGKIYCSLVTIIHPPGAIHLTGSVELRSRASFLSSDGCSDTKNGGTARCGERICSPPLLPLWCVHRIKEHSDRDTHFKLSHRTRC